MTRDRSRLLLLVLLALACGAALALGIRALTEDEPRLTPQGARPSQVDIGFAQDMVVHHEQALAMAQLAGSAKASPAVAAYARGILLSQSREQGMLQGWLVAWKAPALPSGPPMTWMSGHAGHEMSGHTMTMPGMATQAELDALARMRGKRFDAEFLRLMSRHHLGGVEMAQEAARRAALPEVRSLAALMAREQTEEIAAFRRLAS